MIASYGLESKSCTVGLPGYPSLPGVSVADPSAVLPAVISAVHPAVISAVPPADLSAVLPPVLSPVSTVSLVDLFSNLSIHQYVSTWFAFKCFLAFIFLLFLLNRIFWASLSRSLAVTTHKSGSIPNGYPTGGGRAHVFDHNDIKAHIIAIPDGHVDMSLYTFKFIDHLTHANVNSLYPVSENYVQTRIPVAELAPCIPVVALRKLMRKHGAKMTTRSTRADLLSLAESHHCAACNEYVSVFSAEPPKLKAPQKRSATSKAKNNENRRKVYHEQRRKRAGSTGFVSVLPQDTELPNEIFPPPSEMLGPELKMRIIEDFCKDQAPASLQEAGCAVCGQLVLRRSLVPLKSIKNILHVLEAPGVTRVERKNATEKISEYKGPVIDRGCKMVCEKCRQSIRKNVVPRLALCNNLWIGPVPNELSELNMVERMLIAKVRHNSCFVRVNYGLPDGYGMAKMVSHVVAFESPLPRVYASLPPPLEDMNDVLAIMFTGPSAPREEDYKRRLTPLLVRRSRVVRALDWLILNHPDYEDVDIDHNNLNQYPENEPPVKIMHKESDTNRILEAKSVFDMHSEEGTASGECPFIVHNLTGEQHDSKLPNELKAMAMRRWNNGGKVLGIGREPELQSIYDNPCLYPQMFPWLFPYGLGGVGSSKLSENEHKKFLLMYHDKRFQRDPNFLFAAFSHAQIKASTTGGFLMSESNKIDEISDRFLSLDQIVLEDILKRLEKGEIVKPSSAEEKDCFRILTDLDHIGGKVNGSITSKKHQRSEIWSLTAYTGVPAWYVTLAPPDSKSPICMYFASGDTSFDVPLRTRDQRLLLVANNPVASTRFFNFMIQLFIKHVLGVGSDHLGLFGKTAAYYGTVEQQGRLTLHLHMLIWIAGSPSPDEVRKRLLDPASDFQRLLIEYLENAHVGEFLTGSKDEILQKLTADAAKPGFIDPCETLPVPPPKLCKKKCDKCTSCAGVSSWWTSFNETVDQILALSNIHSCFSTAKKDGTQDKRKPFLGCLDNIWKKCKARFPRPTFTNSSVDATGALSLKKLESMINTVSPVISYLFRGNTDVTNLRSGTALKAVVLYVTDYITKVSLKTHTIFDVVRNIFRDNVEILGGTDTAREKTRRLMTKMVNSLTARMELGAPMVALYLLNLPDHFTSHRFAPFYWTSFVNEVEKVWSLEPMTANDDQVKSDKVMLIKMKNRIVGLPTTYDYLFRGEALANFCVYDFISRCKREKLRSRKVSNNDSADASLCFEQDADVADSSDDAIQIAPLKKKKAKKATNLYSFLPGHPLCDSHATRCSTPENALVPNFIGPLLPRAGHGDCEYYCMVMLTLFKPHRSPLDLKKPDQTWYEAFEEHEFTPRQLELLKNFNLKYECLDSRDDFHAQLRKGLASFIPSWESTDGSIQVVNELDQQRATSEDLHSIDEIEIEISSDVGTAEAKRRRQVAEMDKILRRLRWDQPKSAVTRDFSRELPSIIQSGSAWKAAVKRKREEILAARFSHVPSGTQQSVGCRKARVMDGVEVIDKSYLERKFRSPEWDSAIDGVVLEFCLNTEQERAFRIVANHVCQKKSEQLKMYIGGMGGTGKSQVLKALIRFFELRNESHRFVVVAPTGSAAALLRGSTYHSMFGVNDREDSGRDLPKLRARLLGVEYVFFDEVSMLSCRDLFRLSLQLIRITGDVDSPFGGMNMIFAGDFAQLPPVIGRESAALYSRTVGARSNIRREQEAAIGKALWHEVVTVVILRKNMRQTVQTREDAKLRTALINMRYKACTPADIAFLRTLVTSDNPGRTSINNDEFRNVSIITAFNTHKDSINNLGSKRFAAEDGVELIDFFSDDKIGRVESQGDGKKNARKFSTNRRVASISDNLQRLLWEAPHGTVSDFIPGKLSLCLDLPVMIRANAATELCITKGQEGTVYAWQAGVGSRGQRVLDTLFVKLTNPPQTVKLDGLPENVVPIVPKCNSVSCRLPDDSTVQISRTQVEVIPNFAMTDFASQGKTRLRNPADLNNLTSHQAYYTALSRSSSAAGTVILQGFDAKVVTGGASPALRQEFRNLELLDTITKLHFDSKLPTTVCGDVRSRLVGSYRKWKGTNDMPQSLHPAIRWKKSDPFLEDDIEEVKKTELQGKLKDEPEKDEVDTPGVDESPTVTTPIEPNDVGHNEPSSQIEPSWQPSTPVRSKRKAVDSIDSIRRVPFKRTKLDLLLSPTLNTRRINEGTPRGLVWHRQSCAYDAVITPIFNLWAESRERWSEEFDALNADYLGALAANFSLYEGTFQGLEKCRYILQQRLARDWPNDFVMFEESCIHTLLVKILTTQLTVTSSIHVCPAGHQCDRSVAPSDHCSNTVLDDYHSLQDFVHRYETHASAFCRVCGVRLVRRSSFNWLPPLLNFDLSHRPEIAIDHRIVVTTKNQISANYKLRGIMYYGDHHFTSRFVSRHGVVWYHDGVATRSSLINDGSIVDVDLARRGPSVVTSVLYEKEGVV
jgi:hypothetical protein